MGDGNKNNVVSPPGTRVAIPRNGDFDIIAVEEKRFDVFCARVLDVVMEALKSGDTSLPEITLREIIDNLVHAVPCCASVVLDPSFKNIYISDTGPGIYRPDLAFDLGYSTATSLHRSIIRGVGLGLFLARENIRSCGGDLYINTQIGVGTYVRIALSGSLNPNDIHDKESGFLLTERQNNILFLLSEGESLGPSDVASELNIGVSTAHRDLVKLQESGFISTTPNGKRFLCEVGRSYLQSLLSL